MKSDQHDMLLALDDGSNAVFYAAPRFHELSEINAAWRDNEVASRSIFVRPSDIGTLDDESHHVAFDHRSAFLCSEPSELSFLNARQVAERLLFRLETSDRNLRDTLPEMRRNIEEARVRGERRRSERVIKRRQLGERTYSEPPEYVPDEIPPFADVPRIESRRTRPLSEEERELRDIADEAAKDFSALLLIVQRART